MKRKVIAILVPVLLAPTAALGDDVVRKVKNVQVGPRPYYLVEEMSPSRLKTELQQCFEEEIQVTDFSIGHRGSALQFPEHTKESYEAAARMGAGILECDVTFTEDGHLVCRHAECDLHTTTNILDTGLVGECSVPPDYSSPTPFAEVRCCTSDITLNQFKTLCGKMDAGNPNAATVAEYLDSTANWRTDLYSTCGTLLSHAEAVELFKELGVGQTPELKSGDAERIAGVFGGQEGYAQALIDELKAANVPPERVWAQSFNPDDVFYWINNEPDYGEQAVFLDGRPVADLATNPPKQREFNELKAMGLNIIAPPMPVLLKVNNNGRIRPSKYARRARRAGLDIISWTTERSGRIVEDVLPFGGNTFYYQTTLEALNNDGDIMTTIDVLAQRVGIIGLFTDWPGTVTFYASCKGL
ncbi:MAG: glycerophosphodiester phosphodiesterase family protein [Myxococcota bacterium]